jgi:predicted  nucleic acid-binding Zn-ribbon protein
MFQLFLRARTYNYFKSRSGSRDTSNDQNRLMAVTEAIENAILTAETERSGLDRRIGDVLARAAVTFGNGTDEYLERDAIDSQQQDRFGIEITIGQRRLAELESQIGHLRFLKTAMNTRFPDLRPDLRTS